MPCPNCHCPSCLAAATLALIGSPVPYTGSPPLHSELMTTNRAPTNSEVAYSRDVISSSEKIVLLIQTMVSVLKKQKVGFLRLINRHKAAILPLRSFPPEILVEIFTQSVAINGSHQHFPYSPPLMLMRICSRWRRIVIDTPRLWTKILSAHPMIDSWITRSKQLPLHLDLDLSSSNSYPVLDALIPHSHRWEHADFVLDSSFLFDLARVRTRLSSLKMLIIYFGDTSGTVDFCEVAPQLTEVKLMEVHQPVIIKLPWEQLGVCTLDSSEFAYYVLQHAKNLWRLHLDMSRVSEPPSVLMPRVPHSHHLGLNVLIIRWRFVDPDIKLFFSSITLPSLQSLEVRFDYPNSDGSSHTDRAELAPIISGFFERSRPRLSTLKLTDIPFSSGALLQCLVFTPLLVSLDIQFDGRWHAIDDTFFLLLNTNHPRHVLPRLRSLSFRGPGRFNAKSLDALITSRRVIKSTNDGVALLEDLILQCSAPLWRSPHWLPRFGRFVPEGLNITYGVDWYIYNSNVRALGGQLDRGFLRPDIFFGEGKPEFSGSS